MKSQLILIGAVASEPPLTMFGRLRGSRVADWVCTSEAIFKKEVRDVLKTTLSSACFTLGVPISEPEKSFRRQS